MKKIFGVILSILNLLIGILLFIYLYLGINEISIGTNSSPFLLLIYFYLIPFSIILIVPSYFILKLNFRFSLIIHLIGMISIVVILTIFSTDSQFATDIQPLAVFLNYISIIAVLIAFFTVDFILILFLILKNPKETAEIKKKILDLSTKITRVEVKEISERVKIDKDTVKKVMKEMVQRKEVFGKYFSTSRALVFNQKANIDEIEQLMEIYGEWEKKEIGKKQL